MIVIKTNYLLHNHNILAVANFDYFGEQYNYRAQSSTTALLFPLSPPFF